MGVKEILKKQLDRVKKLNQSKNNFVYNTDWKKANEDIITILIGINPGKTEKKDFLFFAGRTKEIINLIKSKIDNDSSKIVSMNISNYFASSKAKFEEAYTVNKNDIDEDIIKNAGIVNALFNENKNIDIFCFCQNIDSTLYGNLFLSNLDQNVKEKIVVLKHPSNRHLSHSLALYYLNLKNSTEDMISILKKIGRNL